MFRPTPRQSGPNDLEVLLPEAKLARLERGWPGIFRREIFPMLLEVEAEFADLYTPFWGAPNKSVATILGILILKEFFDYTDQETIEAVLFNLQWQYALGLTPEAASVCQKTLHNFRERMFKSQKHQRAFEHVTTQIIDRFGLDTSHQRMDSTHVVGAMAQLSRLGLFVKTIEAFLFKLQRMGQKDPKFASVVAQLPKKFHERYLDRKGYFSDTRSSLASRRLDACARDLWELLDRFRSDKKLSQLKQYRQMQRLFNEQCDLAPPPEPEPVPPIQVAPQPQGAHRKPGPSPAPVEVLPPAPCVSPPIPPPLAPAEKAACDCPPPESCAGPGPSPPADLPALSASQTCLPAKQAPQPTQAQGGQPDSDQQVQVALKAPGQIASTSLQNPSDPDATFGHKGKGYQLQLVETCVPTNPFQVLTTTCLQGAHESDQKATIPLLKTLEAQGHKPQTAFADSNYISGENILAAQTLGVDLQGPLPGDTPAPGALSLSEFTFDPTDQEVLACPAGHAPLSHQTTRDQKGRAAYFEKTECDRCPLAPLCPTYPNQTQRRLKWIPEKLATARRRDEQETPAFKDAYKIRSGIEATISHDKNDHGLADLRVRGRPAVELAATFKSLALNVKRAVTYALKTMKNAASPHPQAPETVWAYFYHRKSRLWGLLKGFRKHLKRSQPLLFSSAAREAS